MTVQSEIEAVFADCLRAWNGRDFAGVTTLFTEPGVHVLPTDVSCPPDHGALAGLFAKVPTDLDADEFDRTEIGTHTASQCNDIIALVDPKDVVRHRKDGRITERIGTAYVCFKDKAGSTQRAAIGCWPDWRN